MSVWLLLAILAAWQLGNELRFWVERQALRDIARLALQTSADLRQAEGVDRPHLRKNSERAVWSRFTGAPK